MTYCICCCKVILSGSTLNVYMGIENDANFWLLKSKAVCLTCCVEKPWPYPVQIHTSTLCRYKTMHTRLAERWLQLVLSDLFFLLQLCTSCFAHFSCVVNSYVHSIASHHSSLQHALWPLRFVYTECKSLVLGPAYFLQSIAGTLCQICHNGLD